MFDHKVRLLTEGMARAIGRRKFLTQVGAAVFAGVATLASGRALGGTVLAQQQGGDGQRPPADPFAACKAPNNTFCSVIVPNSSDGCQGAYCFQHFHNSQVLECHLSYNWGYSVGCWTVMDASGGGYWTCCDCDCGTTPNAGPSLASCGCARHTSLPMPVSN